MRRSVRGPLFRLALSWGFLLIAFLVGLATGSTKAFIVIVALGVVASIAVRFAMKGRR